MTTVGVLGGGQLGRMLALAGYPLGLGFRFLDPDPEAPARHLGEHIVAGFDDADGVETFLAGVDVVTYEFENVPAELTRALEQRLPVRPGTSALEASQDRLTEKTLFRHLGVPTAPFVAVESRSDLDRAVSELGYPCILKTRRFGYDGKGQYLLRGLDDRDPAFASLGGVPLILEGFVRFDRELSLVAARGADGALAFYPLVENRHGAGILRTTLAPAPGLSRELQVLAETHARSLMETLTYVGVLAIEFFEKDGRLIANEMAPRVHNSGHWTIEGAATSQFENHLRAIVGLPLGSTDVARPCGMINLIGSVAAPADVLAVPDAHLHLYGKQPRPGRKLGHVTVRGDSELALARKMEQIRATLK
jgi:5-(carboxyamino)imidazole ribonucleotide synthase